MREQWIGGAADSARALLARLKGHLRRLDVRVADEFEDEEYGQAAEEVASAARTLAANVQVCVCG